MRNTTLNAWILHLKNPFNGKLLINLTAFGSILLAGGGLLAAPTVTTLGGGSTSKPYNGYVNGNTLAAAKFNMPAGMAFDPSGSHLLIADYTNNAIRLVSQPGNTASSVTTTYANSTNSGISHPIGVVVDGFTNIFVLNQGTGANGSVIRIGGAGINSGLLSVYPSLATGLSNATAIAIDGNDNLYVTDNGNKVIRVTTNGVVTSIGTISQAGAFLRGITVLDNGQLALADAGNNGIWVMNPANGTSVKLTGFHGSGDVLGAATAAAFNAPANLAKAGGGTLVVADSGNNKVKLVDQSGSVTLLYGVSSNLWVTGSGTYPGWADGSGSSAQDSAESRLPYGVVVGSDGSVYVTEVYYHILRHVTGTGLTAPQPGYLPSFPSYNNGPAGIAFDSLGNYLFIANYTNNLVQVLDFSDNLTSTFLTTTDGVQNPISVCVDTRSHLINTSTG